VIWDFSGEPIPEDQLIALRELMTPSAALVDDLQRFLNTDELVALTQRAEILVKTATFPLPPTDRRAFPYPPL
jgi:hypothetical protein